MPVTNSYDLQAYDNNDRTYVRGVRVVWLAPDRWKCLSAKNPTATGSG